VLFFTFGIGKTQVNKLNFMLVHHRENVFSGHTQLSWKWSLSTWREPGYGIDDCELSFLNLILTSSVTVVLHRFHLDNTKRILCQLYFFAQNRAVMHLFVIKVMHHDSCIALFVCDWVESEHFFGAKHRCSANFARLLVRFCDNAINFQ
jgi:hypothetical protein